VQQLLLFLNKITSYIDSNSICNTTYLDFSKAFDSVPHNELLVKLWRFGVTNNVWYWLREYLYDRKEYVSINGRHSNLLPVISGVPQGSVLGALLFVLYDNDVPFNSTCMHSSVFLFADDTKCLQLIQSIPADMLHLQEDLDLLSSWSHDWKLCFNEIKCLLLQIHNRLSNSTVEAQPSVASVTTPHYVQHYTINATPITWCEQHKDLGVVVTSNLQWDSHIALISSKAYKKLGLLRRSFSSAVHINAKRSLYLLLIRSQLVYCSQIWRPYLLKDITLLERVQRRTTKFILNDFSSNYKSRLIALRLFPLMIFYELYDNYKLFH